MSRVHTTLYRKIWSEHEATLHTVNLDAVDAEFLSRVVIDITGAKGAACKAARASVDGYRKELGRPSAQLRFPQLANDDEVIATGESLRVQKAKALDEDKLAELAISDENVAVQFAVNQAKHREYRALATYLHRGMNHNDAVAAYWLDHPQQQAAD